MAGRVAQRQKRGVGLGDWLLLDDFGGRSGRMVSLGIRMCVGVGVGVGVMVRMRIHTLLLLIGHGQEVHLAEERLAEDKDPNDVLGTMWVGKVAAVHLFLVEIMYLPLISEAKRLNRRTSSAGGEVVAVNVAPCAHALCRVAYALGTKRARVGAREVRLEHGGIEISNVLASLARVVPDTRAMEDVHELLRRAPVEGERAVPRQLRGRPGKEVTLVLGLTMDLALTLALALALTVTLALALARMGRGQRKCHG
jgi:hypothetical protein